ncbi:MAG TPA: hypothetical protein DDY21_00115 [Candidatus Moranbacteria bacterium]|nr:hypothetical protein [Candidatus Moranbacteria bacterium]
MNIFKELFGENFDDYGFVFICLNKNRLFISKRGSDLAIFGKSKVVKMRKKHIKLLKNGINEIVLNSKQLVLFEHFTK